MEGPSSVKKNHLMHYFFTYIPLCLLHLLTSKINYTHSLVPWPSCGDVRKCNKAAQSHRKMFNQLARLLQSTLLLSTTAVLSVSVTQLSNKTKTNSNVNKYNSLFLSSLKNILFLYEPTNFSKFAHGQTRKKMQFFLNNFQIHFMINYICLSN